MQEAPFTEAVVELRADGVYVDDGVADLLDEARLEAVVEDAGTPVYIAVVPTDLGERVQLVQELQLALDRPGTHVVVNPEGLNLRSDFVEEAPAIARRVTASPESAEAAVTELVIELGDEVQGRNDDEGNVPGWVLALLLVGIVGGLAWLAARRRRRERERQQAVLAAREALRPSLSLLAEDVLAMEAEVVLHEGARGDYEEAVRRYRWAEAAIGSIHNAQEAARVQRVLDEGTYAMARARAIVQGREPPAPPPELTVPGPNREPAVVVGDDGLPGYAGYGGGWYGGGGWFGGNLLTGMILGSMLGGGGWGWGGGYGSGDGGGGDGGDGGWGDGGGDWGDGGGDFGGGDVGGGDFGGGDFG